MLLFCTGPISAQQKTVTGTVLDERTNEPMAGVTVLVKGTTLGGVTDASGKFSVNVPDPNATLVFSFVGYASVNVPVGGKSTLDVKLSPQINPLEEVVVIGYGTQKKATLTGSISSVKGDDLVLTPVSNVSNSLSGILSGAFVTTGSSEPGFDASTIRIRGISTFNNSSPLIVVDGVPGRSLDRIDPNTIESISLLKDASSTIYGAQAANGVILITTKRGKVGKPTFAFSYNVGFGTPTTLPKMTNAAEYATMLNEVDLYNGVPNRYSDNDIKLYQNGSDPLGHPNTDWYSATLKKWSAQRSGNLSISGGSESFRYFLSGSTKFQDAFYKNSSGNYKQNGFRANLDGKINKYISLQTNIEGRLEDRSTPADVPALFETVSRSKPTMIALWPQGLPGPAIESGMNPAILGSSLLGYNHDENYVFNSNLKLIIDVPWVKGLSFNLMATYDEEFEYNKAWRIPWYLYYWDGSSLEPNGDPVLTKVQWGTEPNLSLRDDKRKNILTSAQLNYKIKISGNQSLDLMGAVEKITGNSNYLEGYRRFFISTAIDELSAGGQDQRTNGGSSYSSARLNYFGRLNYNAFDRYLIEFQWRYQGSYIFSKDKRFGFFPGVSLGYVVSSEDYWKNSLVNLINYFKIRASYGKAGNDLIAPYQYLSSYYIGPLNSIINGGTGSEPELFENVIANPNATWESATQRDIGIDVHFLKDALSLTVDYFSNKRDNILTARNASVPATAGLVLPNENIGKAENKGFDFDIVYRNKPNTGKLSYQIGFNGVYSKNKLIFWDETPGVPDYQKAEGAPLFAQLYYVSLGIFKDQNAVDNYPHWDGARPGDVIFEDVNGDGKIDANDRVRRDKTNFPTTSGALSLRIQYKGFDLSALIQGAAGAERYIFGYSGEIGNYFKDFYDNRWTETNPNSSGPRTYNWENQYWACINDYSHQSTQFLHKMDYIRLKTIEIGYNLPSPVINKIGVDNLKIYVSAFNLFTIAPDLKDFDPEMTQARGYGYPLQKIINLGISLKF